MDKDLVLAAVSCGGQKSAAGEKMSCLGGLSLQYASEELRADREVVFKALDLGNQSGPSMFPDMTM